MSPSALLIADCGATSGKWAYIDRASGSTVRFTTGPVNASIHDLTRIASELVTAREQCPSPPSALLINAAGAVGDSIGRLQRLAAGIFGLGEECVKVQSDLAGTARALLGGNRGIACILGTGSNSCLWDGTAIVRNMPPMGYILGDEGSGAAIGAALLRKAIRRQFPAELMEAWDAAYPALTYTAVVEEVYRRNAGSTYTASFASFAGENIAHPDIAAVVDDAFDLFFAAIRASYPELDTLPASFTGGIASRFESRLRQAASRAGIMTGVIAADPMEMLIARILAH